MIYRKENRNRMVCPPALSLAFSRGPYQNAYNLLDQHKYMYHLRTRAAHWSKSKPEREYQNKQTEAAPWRV